MQIGAHISVAQGYAKAADYAAQVGCECLQVFAKSPRQWRGPATDATLAAEFTRLRGERHVGPLFTHTAYLLNLSTDDDVLWEKSIDALADELVRACLLAAEGVVTHIGNDRTADPARAAGRVAEAVTRAFDRAGSSGCHARLLLENTAGAGTSVGCTPEELGRIVGRLSLPASRLGVCLDTCHAHAFGYDLSARQGWHALLGEIERHLGVDRLGLIHANDCSFPAGARRDRHAWIGDGTIGLQGFRELLCEPALATVPCVTEMPGEVPDKDVENLRRLRGLRDECAG